MRIESFSFQDHLTGWELREWKLDRFNLLVGESGVGKTKILRAIEQVARASGPLHLAGGASWTLRFEHEGCHYHWRAVVKGIGDSGDEKSVTRTAKRQGTMTIEPAFEHETLEVDGQELAAQDAGVFRFKGKGLPKLNRASSAISLLAGESEVATAIAGLNKIVEHSLLSEPNPLQSAAYPLEMLERVVGKESPTLFDIQEQAFAGLIQRAYMMQEALPDEWEKIKVTFRSIFASVEDLKISRADHALQGMTRTNLSLWLHEREAREWVGGQDISAGMRRVLATILGIRLTPDGSVILIDELENSLGKNCLPAMVDLLLENAHRMQFIITSHHPYVINNIPISEWKLVQRKGSIVSVKNARDIPALQRTSHFEAFDRLMNLPDTDEAAA